MFDLGTATTTMTRLVTGVDDSQLHRPTPCAEWTVGGLLAHIHQFASVFTTNARKEPMNPPTTLVGAWRTEIPAQLSELAVAWRDPAAWEGSTEAGGVQMSAADNAVVAAEELTVHGWDLARATGQEFDVDDAMLNEVDRFLVIFGDRDGPFGPRVEAPLDAGRLDQIIAATGRYPRWSAPA